VEAEENTGAVGHKDLQRDTVPIDWLGILGVWLQGMLQLYPIIPQYATIGTAYIG